MKNLSPPPMSEISPKHDSQSEEEKTTPQSSSVKKEKIKPLDYVIILVIFSVTGTTAAIFPRWIMPWTGLEKGTWLYVLGYILFITPIYQVLLLGYAFIFGKFSYFWDKQKKLGKWIWKKMGGNRNA